MKRLLIFLTLLTLPGVAHAGDPTTEFLEAPLVGGFVTLSSDGKTVTYIIDGGPSSGTADGKTFRSNGQIAIHIQNFNPLTQVWTVEAKATPDANFTAIQAFLSDLKSLQDALPAPPTPPSPAGGEEKAKAFAAAMAAADDCEKINLLIQKAYEALTDKELTAASLKGLVNGATGYNGVNAASVGLLKAQGDIDANVKNAQDALDLIRKTYSRLKNTPTANCKPVTGQILVDYVEVRTTADSIIATKEAIRRQIDLLLKTLQPFLGSSSPWFPNTNDYVISTVTPTFADQQNVTATAKVRSVSIKADSIVDSTDDINVTTAAFVVRKNSIFAAERAAAIIYNNLKYPQYGTAKNGSGATVVQRTADHQPINGALMLNLVMRLGSPSVAYPFLQLGVSSAKDFPGFLAGVGLRFVHPFNFSLSAGGMITRFKDLDGNLKIGDTVTGTDDINKHLVYKTSPVVIYGAMQLKF